MSGVQAIGDLTLYEVKRLNLPAVADPGVSLAFEGNGGNLD